MDSWEALNNPETLSGIQSVFKEMAHANGIQLLQVGIRQLRHNLLGFSEKA